MFLLFADDVQSAALLDRVVAQVEQYNRALPRITAEESITSDLLQHGFYRAHAQATASIRVFSADGGKTLREARTYLTLNGKPVAAGRGTVVPFQLNGAFSQLAGAYLSAAHRPCYTFTAAHTPASSGITRLKFESSYPLPAGCTNAGVVLAGVLDLDTASAHIRRLQRTVLSVPDGKPMATVISVEYAPAMVGNQTFWLPTTLYAEYDKGAGHFRATYSNYHQYTSSATLLTPEAGEPPADPQ